ncbi:hypothetical protein Bca52824_066250 [Brassica carinata]|uniref:Uncharacterized protein n=1 Tax=Brassica carinata TaxID=52824 RepID=A0A8X7U9X3_BRACI|nr:hypothetical protein Bca52824_066250 [Brassica carinata]
MTSKRFEKVQKEMAELKQAVSQIGSFDTMGKDKAEIPCPSATMGKSSESCPAATKEKGKGKVEESVVPPTVSHSPRQEERRLKRN